MLEWGWPQLIFLLPLPQLVRWLIPSRDFAAGAIKVPFYQQLSALDSSRVGQTALSWTRALLLWLAWACLLAAAARPTWVGDPVALPQERRDLMLAVDISGSMQEQDMLIGTEYVPRITAVKAVVGDFIAQRASDRLGLILFGQQGYLQTPLTHDSQTVRQQLEEAQLGFAGNATAIGDTIGLAIKRLRDRPADSRVLILLTDGANNVGTNPLTAANIAAEAEIRIHTVGIGADAQFRRDFFGRTRKVNPSADLDEAALKQIANATGGQYFRARDPQELENIYAELDRLEPVAQEQTFRPTRSLAQWPMLIALLLSVLLALLLRRAG